mgnify:CR=1 FL=1
MAGIGVKLKKVYEKSSLLVRFSGFAYSMVVTIAPMVLVIVEIFFMGLVLGYNEVEYYRRELFSCTVLYIFIFSQLSSAPFNAVLSRYMSDVIYEERYGDIMPAFYVGFLINSLFSGIPAIIFCLHEYSTGNVDGIFVFLGFAGYISSMFVFYCMLYLSICKDYSKITGFYFLGMGIAFILGIVFVKLLGMEITMGMLAAVDTGFFIIAVLEYAQIKSYFRENNRTYSRVMSYFKSFFLLIISNGLYVAGLYVHNFVFWTTDIRMVVADSFVCAEPYDMATFLALVTNISSSMIFISNVELRFHDRYKKYSEAIIGGRLIDIENTKLRMFRQLSAELLNLARTQFIISVIIFLTFLVFLPRFGFSGMVMQIYPMLAVSYYVLFLMYGGLIFLYYFNDLLGAAFTSILFFVTTLIASIGASHLDIIWYGVGLLAGSVVGWWFVYFRIRWVERNIEEHTFCRGTILAKAQGKVPSSRVYVKRDADHV